MRASYQDYISLLRQLAELHVDIGHSEEHMHFARINLSKDPYLGSAAQLREFTSNMGNKLYYPCLLALAYRSGYSDNGSDNLRKKIDGGFIILDKVPGADPENEEKVQSRMESIGEDILALLHEYFDGRPEIAYFHPGDIEQEFISKVGSAQLYGAKFYFTLDFPSTLALDTSKFLDQPKFEKSP